MQLKNSTSTRLLILIYSFIGIAPFLVASSEKAGILCPHYHNTHEDTITLSDTTELPLAPTLNNTLTTELIITPTFDTPALFIIPYNASAKGIVIDSTDDNALEVINGPSTLFQVNGGSGNTTINGSLQVLGASQIKSELAIAPLSNLPAIVLTPHDDIGKGIVIDSTSDHAIEVNSDKFTVQGSTGNTIIAGTLAVGSADPTNGALIIDNAQNTTVTHTLTVKENNNVYGNTSVGGTLSAKTLRLATGTAAAPSLQFSGSTNTGISAPTSNQLSFDVAGSERMKINSSGITTSSALMLAHLIAHRSIQTVVPVTNSSVQVANGITTLLLKPSAPVSNFKIDFPINPIDGQLFTILLGSTNTITLINANGSIINPITSMDPMATVSGTTTSTNVTYMYSATDSRWYRYSRG
jgi:hypothetical protein